MMNIPQRYLPREDKPFTQNLFTPEEEAEAMRQIAEEYPDGFPEDFLDQFMKEEVEPSLTFNNQPNLNGVMQGSD